jgi:alanine racemase
MDMITVDVTDVPQVRVGSTAVLWGEGLPADEVATVAGTIAYELFCRVTRRVPLEYFDL